MYTSINNNYLVHSYVLFNFYFLENETCIVTKQDNWMAQWYLTTSTI